MELLKVGMYTIRYTLNGDRSTQMRPLCRQPSVVTQPPNTSPTDSPTDSLSLYKLSSRLDLSTTCRKPLSDLVLNSSISNPAAFSLSYLPSSTTTYVSYCKAKATRTSSIPYQSSPMQMRECRFRSISFLTKVNTACRATDCGGKLNLGFRQTLSRQSTSMGIEQPVKEELASLCGQRVWRAEKNYWLKRKPPVYKTVPMQPLSKTIAEPVQQLLSRKVRVTQRFTDIRSTVGVFISIALTPFNLGNLARSILAVPSVQQIVPSHPSPIPFPHSPQAFVSTCVYPLPVCPPSLKNSSMTTLVHSTLTIPLLLLSLITTRQHHPTSKPELLVNEDQYLMCLMVSSVTLSFRRVPVISSFICSRRLRMEMACWSWSEQISISSMSSLLISSYSLMRLSSRSNSPLSFLLSSSPRKCSLRNFSSQEMIASNWFYSLRMLPYTEAILAANSLPRPTSLLRLAALAPASALFLSDCARTLPQVSLPSLIWLLSPLNLFSARLASSFLPLSSASNFWWSFSAWCSVLSSLALILSLFLTALSKFFSFWMLLSSSAFSPSQSSSSRLRSSLSPLSVIARLRFSSFVRWFLLSTPLISSVICWTSANLASFILFLRVFSLMSSSMWRQAFWRLTLRRSISSLRSRMVFLSISFLMRCSFSALSLSCCSNSYFSPSSKINAFSFWQSSSIRLSSNTYDFIWLITMSFWSFSAAARWLARRAAQVQSRYLLYIGFIDKNYQCMGDLLGVYVAAVVFCRVVGGGKGLLKKWQGRKEGGKGTMGMGHQAMQGITSRGKGCTHK